MDLVTELKKILGTGRYDLQDEKVIQMQISDALTAPDINHVRELRLSPKDIIDFYLPTCDENGIGIEIKLSGNAKIIYKQLERYCKYPQISEIILITNKTIGLPKAILGKPTHIIKLGRAWL